MLVHIYNLATWQRATKTILSNTTKLLTMLYLQTKSMLTLSDVQIHIKHLIFCQIRLYCAAVRSNTVPCMAGQLEKASQQAQKHACKVNKQTIEKKNHTRVPTPKVASAPSAVARCKLTTDLLVFGWYSRQYHYPMLPQHSNGNLFCRLWHICTSEAPQVIQKCCKTTWAAC